MIINIKDTRYVGRGNPSVVDNIKTFFRTLLSWVTTILWFLSPFSSFLRAYILFLSLLENLKKIINESN